MRHCPVDACFLTAAPRSRTEHFPTIRKGPPDDRRTGLLHLGGSRGGPTRSGDRRAGNPDLSDDRIRLRRCRPRGFALRPASLRQHLFAHRQSDLRRARGEGRRARGRNSGARRRFRPCGGVRHLPHLDAAGRRAHRGDQALRRLDQPVQSRLQEFRLDGALRRSRRSVELRGRAFAEDQGDLRRVDRQSGRRHHRHRGDLEGRQEGQRAVDRRQHHGHPLPLAPLRARRGHHRPFGHEVPGGARQLHRRRDRRRRQVQLARR